MTTTTDGSENQEQDEDQGATLVGKALQNLATHLQEQIVTALATPGMRQQETVIAAAEMTAMAFDRLTTGLAEAVPPPRPLACGPGCARCCSLTVLTDIPTVFRMTAMLQQVCDQETLSAIVARLHARRDALQALPPEERQAYRAPCPLLTAEATCQIYEGRPLICRGLNSFDAADCDRERVSAYRPLLLVGLTLMPALTGAFQASGCDSEEVELAGALLITLGDPQACTRWLDGEPIFQSVHGPEFV